MRNSTQFFRLLAADRFDLLTDDEKRQLAGLLERHPNVAAAFAERVARALGETREPERERAFAEALEAAELELAGASPKSGGAPEAPARKARAVRTVRRVVLAAAAGAAALWLFSSVPDQTPPVDGAGQSLNLNASRTDEMIGVDLDASDAPNLVLLAEARIELPRVRWRLLDGGLEELLSGSIEFSDEGTALRSIAVPIPKHRLDLGSSYWFVLVGDEGETLRSWSFRTD